MTSKRIVIAGGCALAFGAAFANTGLVLNTGTSVSHLTGDIAHLTISLTNWSPSLLPPQTYRVIAAATSFLAGATAAGLITHHPTVNISRPYGRTITWIGLLFLISSLIVHITPISAISLAAFGCGIQNSIANHYRGIILRTTHLTGMFTDFGVTVGMKLRGHNVPRWKIAVPALLITSFFLGSITGAIIQLNGIDAILIAGVAYCTSGIAWTITKHVFHRV